MRLLHLGSGFRPMRKGGLVAYIHDLTAEQVRRGHQVGYFFSGRFYPYLRGPRLRRWNRQGVEMLEVVNSPLHDHGRQPELELSEPRIERMLSRLLDEIRPEVVHVQELAGLPTSLLDVTRSAGVPTVMTLQDYYPLCPTFKLLDADGRTCLRRDVGDECVAATAAAPSYPPLLYKGTLTHDLARLPLIRDLPAARRDERIDRIATRLSERWVRPTPTPSDAAKTFQTRRDVNVERLSQVDRLLAMSSRVADLYTELGVDRQRIRTVALTLRHIERLRPRQANAAGPVTFATLGGLESDAKGARVLLDAMRLLAPLAEGGRLRLLVFGYAHLSVVDEAGRLAGVELRQPFRPDELDRILDEVDVGIMPSIWEEAYGYAGIEFLAKAIPVIANRIGGMVDYVREGETGWLNDSCAADGLSRIMNDIVEDREHLTTLNEHLRACHDQIVKKMADHGDEMDAIYGELLAGRYDPAP